MRGCRDGWGCVDDEGAVVREIPKQTCTAAVDDLESAHVDQHSLPCRQVIATGMTDALDVRTTEDPAQPHRDARTHAAVDANVEVSSAVERHTGPPHRHFPTTACSPGPCPGVIASAGWPAIPVSRTVRNCTMSFEKNRSSVQSSATRSFFSKRGSFSRYTVLQSHHAGNPEKWNPKMRATPVRLPMAASCPRPP